MSERAENRVHEVREPEAGRADTSAIALVARILRRRRRLQQRQSAGPARKP